MAVLVIVSCGARRVELACAGPPHWRGSLPFSGANAVSAHSTRRACLCFTSLSLFSVSRLCFVLFSYFCLSFFHLFLLSSLPYFPSLFCSVAPFSLCLNILHPVSRASLFILIFSPLLYTQPHTLSHVTPRLAFMPFFLSLFPVG